METRKMTEIAILLAVAAVLEAISTFIPFLHMPNGGSVSLGMLPIFIIAYRHGLRSGLLAGFIFSLVNFMLGGLYIHWGSIIFDYTLAFTVIGFAGLFKKNAWDSSVQFGLGIFVGGFLRYIMHGIAGVLFWGEYAPEGMGVYYYSFIWYNLPYMAASIVLCIIVGLVIKDRVPYFKSA